MTARRQISALLLATLSGGLEACHLLFPFSPTAGRADASLQLDLRPLVDGPAPFPVEGLYPLADLFRRADRSSDATARDDAPLKKDGPKADLACQATCPTGNTCIASVCTCDTTACDKALGYGAKCCFDPLSGVERCTFTVNDPNNCGVCGKQCQSPKSCIASACH